MNIKTSMALAATLACGAITSAQAQVVFDYAARWSFDDCNTASSVLADASGNNVTAARGSFLQCTTDAEGRANGATNFVLSKTGDGAPQSNVTVSNKTFLPLSNQFAMSVRVKPGSVPEGALLTKGWVSGTGPQKAFQLGLQKDAAGTSRAVLTVWFKPTSGTTPVPVTLTSNITIKPSVWARIGASYSPSGGLSLLINDTVVAVAAETRLIADEPSGGVTNSTWMGGGLPGQTRGYTGALDDVWVSTGGCADLTAGRTVTKNQELMVTHVDVVDDPLRTVLDRANAASGHWSFGWLMEQMVPAGSGSADAAADMVEKMLETWRTIQQPEPIVGFTVPARANGINSLLLNAGQWPRLAGSNRLDLTKSPLRLLAIVNRMDLQNLNNGRAGEGRFVFGVLNPVTQQQTLFTFILEYNLPARTDADLRLWAKRWHELSTLPLGSPQYNAALEAITDKFAIRGAAMGRTNDNAISQVRTNEIALAGPWELREFQLTKDAAGVTSLKPALVALTPDSSLKNTVQLTNYINKHAANIVQSKHTMSPAADGAKLQGGASLLPGNTMVWDAAGVQASGTNTAAFVTRLFALNTCNGCHLRETKNDGSGGGPFLHVRPRDVGQEATLSGFLTGIPGVADPRGVDIARDFNDLQERSNKLTASLQLCTPSGGTTTFSAARVASTSTTTQQVAPVGTVVKPVTQATTGRVH
jgi:hypothetical protein